MEVMKLVQKVLKDYEVFLGSLLVILISIEAMFASLFLSQAHSLTKQKPQPAPRKATKPVKQANGVKGAKTEDQISNLTNTLSLKTNQTSVSAGQSVWVDVDLNTQQAIDGVDVIINYDPAVLEYITTEPTTLFDQYPVISHDPIGGQIVIQALNFPLTTFAGSGTLARIKLSTRTSGNTRLQFLFAPNETVDSNLAAGGQDILDSVNNLYLNVR